VLICGESGMGSLDAKHGIGVTFIGFHRPQR
jgi:hypothetical protein